jgi:enoyl-CoA hydratase
MTAYQFCRVSARDGVLTVMIDREAKRNALSLAVLAELKEAFSSHSADATLKFAILTAAGDKCFAAGGDLHELMNVKGAEAAAAMARQAKDALAKIRTFPVPVIAALNGDALGGGAELAVSCDLRVAAAHARIGFIQGRLAIPTAWGGGADLMRLVGAGRALQLLSRSEIVGAPQALAYGLFNDAASEAETLSDVLERFTAPMRQQAPQVMRAFKALQLQDSAHWRQELDTIETVRFGEAWAHPDHDAAVARVLKRME